MINQFLIKFNKLSVMCFSIRNNHTIKNNSKLERGLNNQVKAEHEASLTYLKLAIYFLHPCISRKGFGGYFMKLYKEELSHMQTLIQYQLLRGFHPIIEDIKSPTLHNTMNVCQAYELAYQLENNVTMSLKDLVKLAELERDHHCADFITATFLLQQIQSTNELWHHLTNLRRLSDNELALYHYDTELSKNEIQ